MYGWWNDGGKRELYAVSFNLTCNYNTGFFNKQKKSFLIIFRENYLSLFVIFFVFVITLSPKALGIIKCYAKNYENLFALTRPSPSDNIAHLHR